MEGVVREEPERNWKRRQLEPKPLEARLRISDPNDGVKLRGNLKESP